MGDGGRLIKMKKFLFKILISLIPFFILLLVYIASDPFKVIRRYDSFYPPGIKGSVGLDKDYVSTTTFDNNYQKEKYNSFIFGASISFFFQVSDWKKHLDGNSHCYHFDATGESLYAMQKKIAYIDSKNIKIKNALVILDYLTLILNKPRTGHIYAISPHLENNKNLFSFHFTFLKAFFSPKFLYAYIDYKLSGKVKPYMQKNHLLDDRPIVYDNITNEMQFVYFEELISKGKYYTEERKKLFFQRDTIQTYSPVAIAEDQKRMLQNIFDVFLKHKTNYKIIISPGYNQIKLNTLDLDYLNQLFGRKNVFDFSGINKFTNDYNDYYETMHYRPHVAREIMKVIYEND
jgi:hypothetical protein